MSPDDIDNVVLKLYDFLVYELGCDLGEDEDFNDLSQFMLDSFEPFYTKDRNYN